MVTYETLFGTISTYIVKSWLSRARQGSIPQKIYNFYIIEIICDIDEKDRILSARALHFQIRNLFIVLNEQEATGITHILCS